MSQAQQDVIRGLMKEMLKGKEANFSEFAHADATFVVPGGPPLPLPVLADMCGGMLQAFPWTNDVKFPEECSVHDQNANFSTVKALTKQILGSL